MSGTEYIETRYSGAKECPHGAWSKTKCSRCVSQYACLYELRRAEQHAQAERVRLVWQLIDPYLPSRNAKELALASLTSPPGRGRT